MSKIPVAVVGATGMVGIETVCRLHQHPWFDVVALHASKKRVGDVYHQSVPRSHVDKIPLLLRDMPLRSPMDLNGAQIVFICTPGDIAETLEPAYLKHGCLVSSNASNRRIDPTTQLVIPELLTQPITKRILKCPNCCVAALAPVLKALSHGNHILTSHIVTMQSLSGAGFRGAKLEKKIHTDIAGEATKIKAELHALLPQTSHSNITVQVNRVPVENCHTMCVVLDMSKLVAMADIENGIQAVNQSSKTFSSVSTPLIRCVDGVNPDLSRLNNDWEMSVCITQLEIDVKRLYCHISVNNLVRGASGAVIQNAELLAIRWLNTTCTV